MAAECTVTFVREAQQEAVLLSGIIDIQAESSFEAVMSRVSGSAVVFDFSNVSRINSMGIALILRCFKRLGSERKCAVQVRGLSQINSMLFKMSGLFMLAQEVR